MAIYDMLAHVSTGYVMLGQVMSVYFRLYLGMSCY
jgi:hypothetical protein